jgi:hypothetical protein
LNYLVDLKILDSFDFNGITRYRLKGGFERYSKLIEEAMLRSWFIKVGENLQIPLLKEMRHYIEIEFLLNEKRIKEIMGKKPEVYIVPSKNVNVIGKKTFSYYFS